MTLVVVLIVVAALAALGLVLYHRRGGIAARDHRKVQSQLVKQLAIKTKQHASAIKAAEKRLTGARSTYDQRIRDLEQELHTLRDPNGRLLGSYQSVTLHELSISTPQGQSYLIGATAAVDTAGNLAVSRRGSLTRTVAGGVLFGPVGAILGGAAFKKEKKHDTRELYLMIETPTLVAVIPCPPDQGLQARAFAAKIQTAAKQAEFIASTRPMQIVELENRLVASRGDTAQVGAAEQALNDVTCDPIMLAAIGNARQALQAHASNADQRPELPPAQ